MATMFDLEDQARKIQESLPSREYTLGKGLIQPFNETNSGSRKIMQSTQSDQNIQVINAEIPIISTGAATAFGQMSSNYIWADTDFVLVDKIEKNKYQYTAILYDKIHNYLHCFKRTNYEYFTESYGIDINPEGIDRCHVGGTIKKNTIISKSASYDRANNKKDGVNLTTIYMALGYTTEDPIVLSESAAKKFTSPLFNEYEIVINDNDIPLNLYGDNNYYKAFPDIGEDIKDGILTVIRREKKDDEALYSQSRERLRERTISDTTFSAAGKVIDVEVYCNNPAKLNEMYFNQIKDYNDKKTEYAIKLYQTVDAFKQSHHSVKLTYELSKEYTECKKIADGYQYIKENVFNNLVLRIITREERPIEQGDKITDRYGGKGVVSMILPDEDMPHYKRWGEWHPVEAIYNSSTIINRLNPGQSFETEITYIGEKLLEYIGGFWYPAMQHDTSYGGDFEIPDILDKSEKLIYDYLYIINSSYADAYRDMVEHMSYDERKYEMGRFLESGDIHIEIIPMQNNGMSIDILSELYARFNFPEEYLRVKIKDSNGNPKYVMTHRPLIVGKKYITRMKQLADEKFSAVSLASTNIRGENTKTKANKLHISPIAKTPVRMGSMETSELMQLDPESTVEAIMLLSTSPIARRSIKKLLIGNPFDRNIELDENAKSRNVEIANAYLKCLGLKLEFRKVEKELAVPFKTIPFLFSDMNKKQEIVIAHFNLPYGITKEGYSETMKLLEDIYHKYDEPKYGVTIPKYAESNPEYYKYTSMMEDIEYTMNNLMRISKDDNELYENAKKLVTVKKPVVPFLIEPIKFV